MGTEAEEPTITFRVSKQLRAKILRRRDQVKRLTGITPSIGAVTRALVEEALDAGMKRQKKSRAA